MMRTLFVFILSAATAIAHGADAPAIAFVERPGQLEITIGDKPFASYVYADGETTRPYFAHVHSPCGRQVTRNHPPIAALDRADHPTMHPGIWLAFGDISGRDYWRLKARVVHDGYTQQPQGGNGAGSFAVRNRYLDGERETDTVCWEECRFTVLLRPAGFVLTWDSTFHAERPFDFGDQEEMGLGIRVATPLRVDRDTGGDLPSGTGAILDAAGRRNGAEVWGNAAEWCDYSGVLDGRRVGITIFCHPGNPRASRFHARDYGLLVANPFGQSAFRQGGMSRTPVAPGEQLRLRYGILVHSGALNSAPDISAAFADYVRLAE
jgi:hypothetical protein